ncbi:hypothetical protein PTKIN_Ptkin16aG0019600 [Pterospermum kingtungense]
MPSSLSSLSITDCSLLNSKLQCRKGKEWFKIAHIRSIHLDENFLLCCRSGSLFYVPISQAVMRLLNYVLGRFLDCSCRLELCSSVLDQIHNDIQLKPDYNGPSIPAHRALLAARSEIFRNILDPDDCKAPPSDTITLPELNTEELESFLEFLYSGKLPLDKLEKHFYSLFLVADKYEIPYLQDFCERFMLSSLNVGNVLEILEISGVCSSKILKETALNFIVRNMEDVVFSSKYEGFAPKNPHLCVQITKAFFNGCQSQKNQWSLIRY